MTKAGAMKTGAMQRTVAHRPSHQNPAVQGATVAPKAVGVTRSAGDGPTAANAAVPARGTARHDVETFAGNAEPALVDVLNEPIVHTMMRRDGVAMASLQSLLHDAERLLGQEAGPESDGRAGAADRAGDDPST
ncbi:hypothetical protein [Roseospira goensis]|uniref:Uncharacterized protein n=1 Tax=Roseospira goensis TaxID=391922 RepID=A0A7W6RXF7_9PROT|nr:hypothetical protein [Roseospira goensis]MBB4284876.1 hypothetical protein [Roseospira goensis]